MKSGKRQKREGIELPNQERIRTREEKENYKRLGILEADIIKQVEMKEKIRKECFIWITLGKGMNPIILPPDMGK